jgi:hypothetical protein
MTDPTKTPEPTRVSHASMSRVDESPFRSQCPVCKDGLLLVYRTSLSLRPSRYDNCVACGALFYYTDLMINGEWVYPPLDLETELLKLPVHLRGSGREVIHKLDEYFHRPVVVHQDKVRSTIWAIAVQIEDRPSAMAQLEKFYEEWWDNETLQRGYHGLFVLLEKDGVDLTP